MHPQLKHRKSAPMPDNRTKIRSRSISARNSFGTSPRSSLALDRPPRSPHRSPRSSPRRSPRRSPRGSPEHRTRSPSRTSPSPRPEMRRKSSHWDFDLTALEVTLETLDTENDEFEKTAEIFMAARWSHIRKIRNVLAGEEWVYRSDWVSYWGSSSLECDPIGPSIAGTLFDTLLDKRRQGRVSIRDLEFFAKSSQRLWRNLKERSLQKFSWWEEQSELQFQRNSSELIVLTRLDSEEDHSPDEEMMQPSIYERRTQSEHLLPDGRVQKMIRDITKARSQYEQEINRLTDNNALLTRQNAEMAERLAMLEAELLQIKTGSFCNIPGHADRPETKMLPRTAAQRQRTKPDLFDDFKLDDDELISGVALSANDELEIKKAVGQVQVEAVWKESGELDVDVDLAASLFDSQKRFVRHVMWGPRADRSYRRGVITLHEDVRSGRGDEGEKMDIFLDKMPIDIQYIVISTTVFSGSTTFRDLAACDVKVRGSEGAEEEQNICQFKLSGTSGRDCNAVIMAMFKRSFESPDDSEWRFHAVGRNANGTKVAEIQPVIQQLIDEQ